MSDKSETPQVGKVASVQVCCVEDSETLTIPRRYNRLLAWRGRDFWHQDLSVQARLEPDGGIYLSTQAGDISTLRSKTITIEEFHSLLMLVTEERRVTDLAISIAQKLFANNFLEQGTRLAIRQGDPQGGEKDLGGWCFNAAVEQIARTIRQLI